jgi:hypothetical protein
VGPSEGRPRGDGARRADLRRPLPSGRLQAALHAVQQKALNSGWPGLATGSGRGWRRLVPPVQRTAHAPAASAGCAPRPGGRHRRRADRLPCLQRRPNPSGRRHGHRRSPPSVRSMSTRPSRRHRRQLARSRPVEAMVDRSSPASVAGSTADTGSIPTSGWLPSHRHTRQVTKMAAPGAGLWAARGRPSNVRSRTAVKGNRCPARGRIGTRVRL